MDKKIISLLSIGIIIVFLGGVFFMTKDTKAPTEQTNNSDGSITELEEQILNEMQEESQNMEEQKQEEQNEENTNLWNKYSKGGFGNIFCELEREDEGGKFEQKFYMSGLKMYMDAKITFQGKVSKSYMINDGEYTYLWGTNGPAFKMKNEGNMERYNEENTNGFSMKRNLEQIPYNACKQWKVDASLFNVPEEVEFMDFDNMVLDPNQVFEEVEAVEGGSEMPERYEEDLEKIQDWLPEN